MTPEQQHEAFERPPKGTRKARGENNFTIFFTTVWKTYVFQPIKTLWTELSCRWCSPPTSQRHLWPSTTWSTSSTQVYARNAAMMQAISRAAAFEPRSRSGEPHSVYETSMVSNGFQVFSGYTGHLVLLNWLNIQDFHKDSVSTRQLKLWKLVRYRHLQLGCKNGNEGGTVNVGISWDVGVFFLIQCTARSWFAMEISKFNPSSREPPRGPRDRWRC